MKTALLLMTILISHIALAANSVTITNFDTFGDGLYRGGRPSAGELQQLKAMGIKTVVNLQGGDLNNPNYRWIVSRKEPGEAPEAIAREKANVTSLGMAFLNVPLDSLSPVDENEGRAIGRLVAFLNDKNNQPVFIHCEHGEDRTGLVVALYRVFYEGWTPQAAYNDMVDHGHGMLNQIFTDDVDDFFWAAVRGTTTSAAFFPARTR